MQRNESLSWNIGRFKYRAVLFLEMYCTSNDYNNPVKGKKTACVAFTAVTASNQLISRINVILLKQPLSDIIQFCPSG